MSRSGMGAISLRHPLAASKLAGRRLLPEADVVLAVGSRFRTYGGTGGPSGATGRVVHLDADPAAFSARRETDIKLLGDARLGLAALLARLEGIPSVQSRSAEVQAARAWADEQLATLEPQISYLRAVRAALPDDAILVSELTQVAYVARVGFEFVQPRTNLTPGYQGTLGFGFPAALGAKVGNPKRAVVALSGDGGFGYCMAELATARQYGISVVAVVFNDDAYGNVQRDLEDMFDGRSIGTQLVNPDFIALADAFGVRGVRATGADELAAAVKRAIALDEPSLIEVPVGPMSDPWPLLR
jgi:acetolactate synthase-1/2/3 large subunit